MSIKNSFLLLGVSLVLLLIIFIVSLGFGQLKSQDVKTQAVEEESLSSEQAFEEEPILKEEEIKTTEVPILMYHYVRDVDRNSDKLGWQLSISPEIFDKQMAWLKEKKYVSVHLSDLITGSAPRNAVVLSFDDGLEDFYTTALPILQKYGFTASNSVVTEMIGAHEHMSLEQIRACIDAGIEITSHTLSHADLANLSEDEIRKQVVQSRDFLEQQFGIDIVGFVYPSGKYNDLVVRILAEEGYKIAVTTEYGQADLTADEMLLLPRVRVDNRDGFEGFVEKMERL